MVTFLCDTGERYLSKVFNDEWMQENQLLETVKPTVGDLLASAAARIRRWCSSRPRRRCARRST